MRHFSFDYLETLKDLKDAIKAMEILGVPDCLPLRLGSYDSMKIKSYIDGYGEVIDIEISGNYSSD